MTTLASTFIFDPDGHNFRVGCLACGWRAAAASWKAAAKLERQHRCDPAEARRE